MLFPLEEIYFEPSLYLSVMNRNEVSRAGSLDFSSISFINMYISEFISRFCPPLHIEIMIVYFIFDNFRIQR